VTYGYGTGQLKEPACAPDWFVDSLTDIGSLPPLAWLRDRTPAGAGN
jgi:hypothetical protein